MAHRVAPLALLASRCWRCWVSTRGRCVAHRVAPLALLACTCAPGALLRCTWVLLYVSTRCAAELYAGAAGRFPLLYANGCGWGRLCGA